MKKIEKPKRDFNKVGLTGEFYVLAQLAMRGYDATLTLGHTKGIDVLISNPDTGNVFKVEVKTTTNKTIRTKGYGENIEWIMHEKHGTIEDANLVYIFVQLTEPEILPRFFVIASKDVAKYIRNQHDKWLKMPRTREIKDDHPMRIFRIKLTEDSFGLSPLDYENNWELFDK